MSKRMTRIYLVMFLAGPRTTHTSTHESARSITPAHMSDVSRAPHAGAPGGGQRALSSDLSLTKFESNPKVRRYFPLRDAKHVKPSTGV